MPPIEGFLNDLLAYTHPSAKIIKLDRQDFLLQAGAIERYIYFVERGALRIVYLSEFEEHTIRLGYTGSLITSISSFIQEKPSDFYIQALRKTEVVAISKDQLSAFIHTNQERSLQYQFLLESLIVQQMEREIDLLTPSPIERYRRVFARSPQLFQEVPAKYIASYLRMTPETLSRIQKS